MRWPETKWPRLRCAPDPQDVARVAAALVAAERPVIYAGQGVHYAQAWPQLRALAELLVHRGMAVTGSGGIAAATLASLVLGMVRDITQTRAATPPSRASARSCSWARP